MRRNAFQLLRPTRADNDYLYGGTGNDTYINTTGDGFDTITDTDGLGMVKVGTTQLTGGRQVGSNNTFQSEDKQHTYTYLTGNSVDGGDFDAANDNFWKRSA